MTSESRWISTADAAALLDISEETVRAWCRRRESGERSPIRKVKRDDNGHWLVSRREMFRILRKSRS